MKKIISVLSLALLLASCGGAGGGTPASSISSIEITSESQDLTSEIIESSAETLTSEEESESVTEITTASSEEIKESELTSVESSESIDVDSSISEISSDLSSNSSTESIHKHNFETQVIVEPGCETDGVMQFTCECGEEYTEPIEALGHDYGEWTVDLEPGCETEGHQYRVCSRDKTHMEEENLPSLGHNYGEWVIDLEPGCDTDGHAYRVCSRDENHIEETTVDAHGHNWQIVETPATCEQPGLIEYFCLNDSSHNYSVPTEALGHDYGEWITDSDPTCTDAGHKYRVCSRDETHIEEETIPVIDHNYEDGVCTMCGKAEFSTGLLLELSEDQTYYIIAGIGSCTDTDLVLPSKYEGLPVKEIKAEAFKNNKTVVSVDIPGSIETIGNSAFASSNLQKVQFHEGLKYVGDTAFAIRNLYGFGESAYSYVPDTLEMTGKFAFNNSSFDKWDNNDDVFTFLKSKNHPHLILHTCRYWNINKYSTYYVPKDTVAIAHGALRDAYTMKALYIYDTIERIGQAFNYKDPNAFGKGQCALESLTIPWLGYTPDEPDSLSYFFGGALDHIDHCIPKSVTSLTINGTLCKTLPAHAFAGDYCNIESFTLPDSIETIEEYAFAGCNKIKSLYIPRAVTKLPYRMFSYGRVKNLYISKSLTEFEDGAFDSTSYGTLVDNLYYGGSQDEWNGLTNLENAQIDGRVGNFTYDYAYYQ